MNPSNSSSLPAVSRAINDRVDAVIAKWIERLRKEIAPARDQSDVYLRDHMPDFLKGLAKTFANSDDLLTLKKVRENAKDHGEQRSHSAYTVSHVVNDYIYLREVLVSELNPQYEFSKADLMSLGRFFEAAIGAAVEEFTITNQKKTDEKQKRADFETQVQMRAIETSEERVRSTFAHASVGFVVSDLRGHILEANPTFAEMTGYSVEELQKKSVLDIVHPGDLQMDRLKLDALTSGQVESFVIEKRFVQKTGGTVWVRNSVSLVPRAGLDPLIIRVTEDVTAVREAERQRSMLADSMPQIVWTSTPDGVLDYFNKVWFDYTGASASENFSESWDQRAHPDDLPTAIEKWKTSLKTGAPFETKTRLRSKEGEYRWFMARATPVRDAYGSVQKWYGTNTDIHDFQTVSQDLQLAERGMASERLKLQTLVNDATTPIAVLSGQDLVFDMANDSYKNLFSERVLVGKPVLEALPELIGQAFPKLLKGAFDGEEYREIEALARLARTTDGVLEDRYFDQSYTQIRDQDGKPWGVFIQATDVTERVLARRELEQVAERLSVAIEAANMGTWNMDPETGSITWSSRAHELFGFLPGEAVDLESVSSRIHPDDRTRALAAINAGADPHGASELSVEYRVVPPGSGEVIWVSVLGRSQRAESNEGPVVTRYSGVVWDITERVMAEVSMRDAKERAELANAAKSSFLANMSHEIRTPLGAIMGFVSLIKDESASPQTLTNYISVIERNSTQLMRIIDDILDLSKVEAGMMQIEHIDFSLVELLSDFSSLMGFRAREKGVLFEVKASTELPDIVNSDPTRIRQILTNIVGNAIKFTDAGSVSLTVSYLEGQLNFEVADTGRGISEEQAARLFQPFAQGDPSTTRKYGGTGLGLVLTRRLSEAMGGTFDLKESVIGKGSKFSARIGVQLSSRSKFVRALGFASEPIRNAGVQGQLRDVKILLVEDSPDNQALFSIYLNRAGAKIDIASDGARGVEMALSDSYDVVLMDVQMPIMDGISAVKKLRSEGYETPIIALTAHAMKEEKIRCLEAGYSGFLSKPIQRAELVDALVKFKRH